MNSPDLWVRQFLGWIRLWVVVLVAAAGTSLISAVVVVLGPAFAISVSPSIPALAATQDGGRRFLITPSAGPSGTTVTVASVDPCEPPAGDATPGVSVTWQSPAEGDVVAMRQFAFPVAPDGSWSGTLDVPGRSAGTATVSASCAASATPSYVGGVYASYSAVNFEVTTTGHGYFVADAHGGVAPFGDASLCVGDESGPAAPAVGMAVRPDTGTGVWVSTVDGGVFSYGSVNFYGSAAGIKLVRPVVGMAATPDGHGYWLVASDGGVFAFGTARFFGSPTAISLNKPIVGMVATPDGQGYWLVASDGGVFAYGDASFFGSTGAEHLNQPAVGMAATPDGFGYWLAAADGGVFSFGSARFAGSAAGSRLTSPVTGISATGDDGGYWLVTSDADVFSFGSASFFGSGRGYCGGLPVSPTPPSLTQSPPFVAIAATPNRQPH